MPTTSAPRKFSGVDLVAGVKVKRYISEADPELWLYVHEQSGLPFLIRQGKKTLVSVVSFILDAVEPDKITWVELELLFARRRPRSSWNSPSRAGCPPA